MKEALFYEKKGQEVECQLCPHQCTLSHGQMGRCRVRVNENGTLYSMNYGEVSALQIDPIEKKPIMEWMPGTEIFSVGSYGCNLKCAFCQNHSISLERPQTEEVTPEWLVQETLSLGLPSIAYTYNEPTVFYEMMYETAVLAHEKGLKNVIVTNGFINEAPLLHILPYMDAMNIDLKTYDDAGYKKLGGTEVSQVLKTIELASKACHVEVTMLIVPGMNDDAKEFETLLKKLQSAAPHIVLHLSRYFPRYHYNEPATDIKLLLEFKEIAQRYFNKVYVGNVR